MKYIVITGVSTGIGYGTAKAFVKQGYHVFGSVRKEEDAQRLTAEFGTTLFTPIFFDVRDDQAIAEAVELVSRVVGNQGLVGLINNAGLALAGPLMHQPMADIRLHFDVNVFGLIAVTKAFLPLLGASKTAVHPPGRIFNISSVGGQIAMPLTGAYSGTKFAVEGLSHSLRRELQLYGIDVIIIGPGVVESDIWLKQKAHGFTQYDHTDFAPAIEALSTTFEQMSEGAHTAEEFGELILQAFETKRPKVRYAFVANYVRDWVLLRNLPHRWLDKLTATMLNLSPEKKGSKLPALLLPIAVVVAGLGWWWSRQAD